MIFNCTSFRIKVHEDEKGEAKATSEGITPKEIIKKIKILNHMKLPRQALQAAIKETVSKYLLYIA